MIEKDEVANFPDSEFKDLWLSENSILTVNFKTWNAKLLKIEFPNTIQFFYRLESVPKNLCQVATSRFLDEALIAEYGHIPSKYPFKHFKFKDIDNFPFLEVVAETVNIHGLN